MNNELLTAANDMTTSTRHTKNISYNNLIGIDNRSIGSKIPEVLFITSYPPRECGIATYTQDLIIALRNKFDDSFKISICALETENEKHVYEKEVKYTLDTDSAESFNQIANSINNDPNIKMVVIQHEFGFFELKEKVFLKMLKKIFKPIILVFHTVLPRPDELFKLKVQQIAGCVQSIIVMTNNSAKILEEDYKIVKEQITVIPHGTHLIKHGDKDFLKSKYNLKGKMVLSTFGLLGKGKSIETTLDALPGIIKTNPNVVFLIIGKTHPNVLKREGEKYRDFLKEKIISNNVEQHVQFINAFLPLSELLDYLQLTDIYLFTSQDPNQAVSGTFSYAISCGCPIVSTPIPHALEVLKDNAGIIIDFGSASQLAKEVNNLISDDTLREAIGLNGLHKMASTAWENSAIMHAELISKTGKGKFNLKYKLPEINLSHIKKMTTDFGIVQFSKLNQPDMDSGYTLDDNARALVSITQHFVSTKDQNDLVLIRLYLNFIQYCLQKEGNFLNYVDQYGHFTNQNKETNLEDANGRAIWALGYLISKKNVLPEDISLNVTSLWKQSIKKLDDIHSSRAMAFIIKGFYYANKRDHAISNVVMIQKLADRLVQMYRHESDENWQWFESYLTYGNSILPEALLCAWMSTSEDVYKEIATESFDFLLAKTFKNQSLKVISNKTWLQRDIPQDMDILGGEQPIDVAYTILALKKFYKACKDERYKEMMNLSFNWFLGDNHLHQIIYNPCTGGCYDGLEEHNVNLNQGAESTVSYLMARMSLAAFAKIPLRAMV